MTTQNYEPKLDLVKERMAQIEGLIEKFKDLPEVQQKLQGAKDALQESEEEIMHYYDLTELAKHGLN
jgi:archaellum component FlaC|tara:strand:+ start:1098 stop:1298 length:201 start_codon:yes stop_codon:yes gene_type:complete